MSSRVGARAIATGSIGVSVQQEIAPQVAVEVSYNRRVWSNFFVTHNRALTAADYDEVTLTAPQNPLLPNGGGYPVTFLTRNTRSALGATDSYYTTTDDFGDETHYWHGVDVSFNARMRNGLILQGGTSTGRGVNDTCDIDDRAVRAADGPDTRDAASDRRGHR